MDWESRDSSAQPPPLLTPETLFATESVTPFPSTAYTDTLTPEPTNSSILWTFSVHGPLTTAQIQLGPISESDS